MIINPYYKRKAMTVNYKLLRTSGKLAQRKALRIVPIKKDVTGIERICQHIQQTTTLTTADILGTISALKTELAEELKVGIQSIYRALDSSRLPLKATYMKTLRRIVTISVMLQFAKLGSAPIRIFTKLWER